MTRFPRDLSVRHAATALAIVGLLTTAACSSSGSKPSTSNTTSSTTNSSGTSGTSGTGSSTASAPTAKTPSQDQLTATLIGGDDIAVPGDTFKLHDTQPLSQSGATGIIGSFANADASRTVSDILVYFPTSAAAATATTGGEGAVKGEITKGLKDTPANIGSSGHIYQGQTDQGEATLIVFQEGNYFCTMEFDSKAGDVVPVALATQVGQAQDSKLKAAS